MNTLINQIICEAKSRGTAGSASAEACVAARVTNAAEPARAAHRRALKPGADGKAVEVEKRARGCDNTVRTRLRNTARKQKKTHS
jgi:hypothetical protein